MSRRFVLLDRDGTLIVHHPYLCDPGLVELAPGAGEGLRALAEAGLGLALVTNQSGVGRGYFPAQAVDQVHARLESMLLEQGVRLDGIYVCPHAPEAACRCRKPAPGLVERAARDLGFEPSQSFVVGDSDCDIELGRRIGAATFRVGADLGVDAVARAILAQVAEARR